MSRLEDMLSKADEHLAQACPHMARLVQEHGPCGLKLRPEPFQMLVRSITSQQISGAAARSIMRRLEAAIEPAGITPAAIFGCGEQALRDAGYSARKASYLLGLAQEVLDGSLDFEALAAKPDDQIVERLSELRGIGVWTAQMYLIFCLGRPDVFSIRRSRCAASLAEVPRLGRAAAQARGHRTGCAVETIRKRGELVLLAQLRREGGSGGDMTTVAVALLERDGKVLICRRRNDQAHAGKWEFPAEKSSREKRPAKPWRGSSTKNWTYLPSPSKKFVATNTRIRASPQFVWCSSGLTATLARSAAHSSLT